MLRMATRVFVGVFACSTVGDQYSPMGGEP